MSHQVLAQRTGTDRHDHVVDGATGRILDGLDVAERCRAHREPTVRCDRLVERRRRGRRQRDPDAVRRLGRVDCAAQRQRLQDVARLAGDRRHAVDPRRLGEVAHHSQRQAHPLHGVQRKIAYRALEELAIARHLFADPVGVFRQRGIGGGIGEDAEQEHTGRAVDGGVVGLGEHRPSTVGEALDDVGLPQRPRAVHGSPDDACHLLGKLVGAPGRRQTDVADVIVEIEVGVVDPVGMVESEGHFDQPSPHRFETADECVEAVVRSLVGVEVGRRPFVDRQAVDMAVRGGRLHVQETGVESGQLLHTTQSRAVGSRRHPRGCAPCTFDRGGHGE